jgi:uncharacterized damage-inducible protein DinB
MSRDTLEGGFERLEFARRVTLMLTEEIPDDQLCHQPFGGTNHALWNLGHVAATDNFFMSAVGGLASRHPNSWNALFGPGSQPKPDLSAYPSIAEIRGALAANREALVAWFKSMSDEELRSPLPEELKGFASCRAALPGSIAWHEGFHAGQISVVRKSLGLKPKFM